MESSEEKTEPGEVSQEKSGDSMSDQSSDSGDKAIVWFMVLVLVGIGAWYGVSWYQGQQVVTAEPMVYNGHTFVRTSPVSVQTVVKTAEGEQRKEFREFPGDVDHYEYDNEFSLPLRMAQEANGTVFVSVGPDLVRKGESAIASIELVKVTSGIFGVETRSAVTEEGLVEGKPVVTCENASPVTPVIELVNASETRIVSDSACVTLEAASGEELIEIADVVSYSLLGIIE